MQCMHICASGHLALLAHSHGSRAVKGLLGWGHNICMHLIFVVLFGYDDKRAHEADEADEELKFCWV